MAVQPFRLSVLEVLRLPLFGTLCPPLPSVIWSQPLNLYLKNMSEQIPIYRNKAINGIILFLERYYLI